MVHEETKKQSRKNCSDDEDEVSEQDENEKEVEHIENEPVRQILTKLSNL